MAITCKADPKCQANATHAVFVRDNAWPKGKRVRVPACQAHGTKLAVTEGLREGCAAWVLEMRGGFRAKQVN
jgi:hypothetical protein